MKILFYLSIVGAVVLAIVIFLEKNKKPTNTLLEDKQLETKKNETNTEANLQGNSQIKQR